MKAVSPIVEHMLLSVGALAFFILAILSFTAIQDQLLEDNTQNRLTNLGEQVSLKIVQAYEIGSELEESSPNQPVVRLYLNLPPTISGHSYLVRESEGEIIASSRGTFVSTNLLGLEKDFTIQGKIISSDTRKPAISYYKSQELMVLENVG